MGSVQVSHLIDVFLSFVQFHDWVLEMHNFVSMGEVDVTVSAAASMGSTATSKLHSSGRH